MTLRTATLTAARRLSPSVRELSFDPGGGFTFVPGQWVNFSIPSPSDERLTRAYSIASSPRADGCFEVAVTRVEGGPGSGFLHALEPGASLPMADAQGYFTMPEVPPRPALLVGTGTGVAPLRAMLHAALDRGNAPPMVLLFGVRTQHDVLYDQDFSALARVRPGFRFAPTLSRPEPGWTGRTGYVQTHLRALTGELGDCDVYVCGLNRMIQEVRRVLKEDLGFTRPRIHTERYD